MNKYKPPGKQYRDCRGLREQGALDQLFSGKVQELRLFVKSKSQASRERCRFKAVMYNCFPLRFRELLDSRIEKSGEENEVLTLVLFLSDPKKIGADMSPEDISNLTDKPEKRKEIILKGIRQERNLEDINLILESLLMLETTGEELIMMADGEEEEERQ